MRTFDSKTEALQISYPSHVILYSSLANGDYLVHRKFTPPPSTTSDYIAKAIALLLLFICIVTALHQYQGVCYEYIPELHSSIDGEGV